jgi:endonuclease/exonuclease/phosphatase family metal-dependent hydrolase
MKKLSPLDTLLFIINSLFAIVLLISYLNYFVSPASFKYFAFLSLTVPVLIIVNATFCIYWLLKFKKQFLLSFVVLAIGMFYLVKFYGFKEKQVIMGSDLKIMSYNVRLFNLYDWSDEKDLPTKIKAFLDKKDPDILCIQEYAPLQSNPINYPHHYIKMSTSNKNFGHAIFSKYPIIKRGSFDFEETGNNAIYVDILKNDDTLRIYNVHLESLKLSELETTLPRENSEQIQEKASHSFAKQTEQAQMIVENIGNLSHKSIVTGDFNNNAFSWVYHQLNKGKNDAFQVAGKGFGRTFDYLFPLRIDFILVDEKIKINNFKTYSNKYSDHYPIMARIDF